MPITYGSHENVTASDIAFSIHTAVDAAFYDVLYPEHEWYNVLSEDQIMRDINPGATQYAYISRDRQGAASFIGNGPNANIPMVAQSAGAVNVPVAYAAVGAVITNEDAREYTFGFNGNLSQDLGETMRVACDNLTEQSFFYGNADMNFQPFLNYAGVTATTVPQGESGKTEWKDKTPLEIFNDINNALTKMWQDSRTIFKPTIIYVPLAQYALLSQPAVIGGVGMLTSIKEYTIANATVAGIAGKPLEILPLRYLAGAGASGADRMIVWDRDRRNQCMPMPMPYTLQAPVPAPLAAEFYAEMKIGSFHVRQAGSIAYYDGILRGSHEQCHYQPHGSPVDVRSAGVGLFLHAQTAGNARPVR